MIEVATIVGLALALLTAASAGVRILQERPCTRVEYAGAGLVELAVLVYVGMRAFQLADGHHVSSLGVVIAYLAAMALTMPVAAALSWAEPTKWGAVVMVAGALVVCVLYERVHQLWSTGG